MISVEEEILAFISIKRAKWYVDNKQAAVWLDDKSIKLNFVTNGKGSLGKLHNVPFESLCVVCGSRDSETLTRHHAIPKCFRKHFPDYWKHYRSFEILPVCYKCHEEYERHANVFKGELLKEKFGQEINREFLSMRAKASAVLNHCDKIPKERRNEIYEEIKSYYKVSSVNDATLSYVAELPTPDYYKLYAESISDYQEFGRLWKKHFIEVMNPKNLPDFWTPEYDPGETSKKRKTKL